MLREWEEEGATDSSHQYVIGASACTREETKRDALAVGMDDFTLKPLEIPVLLKQLNDLYENLL